MQTYGRNHKLEIQNLDAIFEQGGKKGYGGDYNTWNQ